WFMGAFFLVAGYFTPGSFERKGPGPFLKDRLVRLGIPLLIVYFVLHPISVIGYFFMPASLTGNTTPLTWQLYPYLIGLGPMWFVAMLLIFSLGYMAWRKLTRNRTSAPMSQVSRPGYARIGLFILALALASYLIRIVIPLGQSVLGFPTLAYFPQYLSFFILGIVAARHNWFRTLPDSIGRAGFVTAAVATVTLFPMALISLLTAAENGASQLPPFGFGTWPSAVYALWDSAVAAGLGLGLITLFRRFFDVESRFGAFLSQHSYATYIIHSPIIVFLALRLRVVELEPLLKFGVAAAIVVPTCFVMAYFLRKTSLGSKIL
ncbi:MAG: acyltransferase family protein, partial [Anaerolineae bacterium]|nr:acyltransferase family protein [Anaerolineae bacterium]